MDLRSNRARMLVGVILAAVVLAAPHGVTAQTQPGAPPASSPPAVAPASPIPAASDGPVMGEMPTVLELYMSSPYINSILLVMSVIAVIIFLFFYLSLTRSAFAPTSFVDDITKLVLSKQFDQAIHLCQQNRDVFASSILQRVIESRDKEPTVLMEILSTEGRRRAEVIWNRIGYLSEISNIAPMLGLLGTVIGMVVVFFTISMDTPGRKIAMMSSGIAEAMSTTVMGLLVAIVSGVFYTLIRSRATRVLAETEQVCHTVADHVHRASEDPRAKRIDALADAARKKLFTGKPEVTKRP